MNFRGVFLTMFLALCVSGCATSFTGSATVSGGSRGCRAKCSAEGLEFAGMIMLGEYSNGCICVVSGADLSHAAMGAVAGGAGSAAGVVMQMRRAQPNSTVK